MANAISEEMLLTALANLTERLGRDPRPAEITTANGVYVYSTYTGRFGSLDNALLIMCGRADEIPLRHSKEELIAALRAKAIRIAWRLTIAEVMNDPHMPPFYEYVVAFGGANQAFHAADLPAPIPTRETLLEDYRREARRIGGTPTTRGLRASKWIHTASTYRKYIGNLTAVSEAAGLTPNVPGGAHRRRSHEHTTSSSLVIAES